VTKWTGTLKNEAGASATVTLELDVTPPVDPPVDPPKVTFPDGANTVTVGVASYPLAAIDPPTVDPNKPGGRDTNQVIIITDPATPKRNQFGFEVGIKDGEVVATGPNLALTIKLPTVTLVLDYILSGHGDGAGFLRKAAVGTLVTVTKRTVPPNPPGPDTDGWPVMAAYWMIGQGKVSQINGRCTRAIVAFYQGTDLVDWKGGRGATNGLTAWRAKGGRDVLVSLGGQGGTVVLDQVDEGIERINRTYFPVDGLDFDAEAFGYTPQQALDVCEATRGRLGLSKAQFIVQITPPGGPPVDKAIAVAKFLIASGYERIYVMHQTYDTDINDQNLGQAVDKMASAIGQERTIVGIMIGDSHKSWTVANAISRMRALVAKYPRLGGAGLWETSRDGTTEVIEGVGKELGIAPIS
jgi:hypothetical protein